MRAGVVRAEGQVVTTVAATDRILIQQKQTSGPNSGQYLPREVTYANLISGGGGALTGNSVAITTAQGDLDTSTALLYTAGVLTVGFTAIPGSVVILPTTAANGSLRFIATNNASNFQSTLTNAAVGQATTYTLPDPGAATANIILSAGTQTIGGVKTFSSVPIGTQYVVQVNLATITALAGAVTAIFSAPFAGTITAMSASVNAAFAASNIVITGSIYNAGTPAAITNGVITIPTAASAAGTTATATPSAANTFVVGNMISATITGGTGTCGGVITLLVTRTA